MGLPVKSGRTLGMDIYSFVQLLSLPRQLRKGSPFQSRLLKLAPCTAVKTIPVNFRYSDSYDFRWPTVANANFGVDVQWRPAEPSDSFQDYRGGEQEAVETRKFLPNNWQKLDLPSQGRTDVSLASVSGPLGSISMGKEEPDPERECEASAEVFPNANKPVPLDESVPKHDTFLFTDIFMELLGADATWKPTDDNFETHVKTDPGEGEGAKVEVEKLEEVAF
ncbi:hypothetical protein DL769_005474 [Monosporascus sp. CRB-8-3]|nr:hypothetical protein DL769_005474 [Monosporascus sp. CRB-8-3]